MLLGVIADDFTGASDIANTLAKGAGGVRGLATTQFLGTPSVNASPACEAGVISLKSRSIQPAEAVQKSLAALRWLQAQGCQQFVFKYCSTFDSTCDGNIGPVGEALADALGANGIVACPAFPATGRTLYMGHLFVGDMQLSESSLRMHPLNPMTDSDLRRWLKHQSTKAVGFVPWSCVRQGSEAIRSALDAAARRGEGLVIVDAITDEDLLAIGEACAGAALITGGSGVALGLPRNFRRAGLAGTSSGLFRPTPGPEAILVGSCSRTTISQIAYHAKRHPVYHVAVDDVMNGDVSVANLVDFIRANEGRSPLVCSSDKPELVKVIQSRHGIGAVARALDRLFADTAKELVLSGIRRLVVAGGETSGAVVSALTLQALAIGPEIAPGVPALSAMSDVPLALALKSGNFGAPDFFEKALRLLEVGA
jgi:uncharacterized protein YgbK (DUF1537 family)